MYYMSKYRRDEPCSVEGCDKKVWNVKRKLCTSHQTTEYRKAVTKTCTFEDCDKPLYAKGYCHPHYELWRKWGNPIGKRAQTVQLDCSFKGCPNKVSSRSDRGLCKGHYMQWWLGKELTPLRPGRPEREVERDGLVIIQRQCMTCGLFKDREDGFYRRRISWQSECKSCMHERTKANRLARELREQGIDVE